MGWNGMRWHEMGWDGMRLDEIGWDWMSWTVVELGCDNRKSTCMLILLREFVYKKVVKYKSNRKLQRKQYWLSLSETRIIQRPGYKAAVILFSNRQCWSMIIFFFCFFLLILARATVGTSLYGSLCPLVSQIVSQSVSQFLFFGDVALHRQTSC